MSETHINGENLKSLPDNAYTSAKYQHVHYDSDQSYCYSYQKVLVYNVFLIVPIHIMGLI